ncbi:MAG: hypothetical protein HY343_00560 [Lentisphaerae bacterium]|nr:hypothetical protein [Lentisphaerota bacterium]
MKRILAICCVVSLASCASLRVPEQATKHSHQDPQSVKSALEAITIPEVRLRNASTIEALAFWSAASRTNNAQGKGVSVIFSGETLPSDGGPTIEIATNNVSSLAFLNEICRQADLVWWLTPKCMVIEPRKAQRIKPSASAPLASSPMARVITEDVVNRHLGAGSASADAPHIAEHEGALCFSFGWHCEMKLARGGQLLPPNKIEEDRKTRGASWKEYLELLETEGVQMSPEEYEKVKANFVLFNKLMSGDDATRYPKIGARALMVVWWDGETITFTTTDGKYDVEISRVFNKNVFVQTRPLAEDISNLYDQEKGNPGKMPARGAAGPP